MIPNLISKDEAIAIGSLRYFTGKPCIHGHISERLVKTRTCMMCSCEKKRKNRLKPEFKKKENEYSILYRDKNRSKINEYAKNRWHNNPGARLDNYLYVLGNREKINERRRTENLSQEQKDRQKELRQKRYVIRREEILMIAKDHSARRRGAEGKFKKSDIDKILESQKFKCAECKKSIKDKYHVDHIQPISKGGTNWPKNLQCLCPKCNMSKSSLDPLDWAKRNGKLL